MDETIEPILRRKQNATCQQSDGSCFHSLSILGRRRYERINGEHLQTDIKMQ